MLSLARTMLSTIPRKAPVLCSSRVACEARTLHTAASTSQYAVRPAYRVRYPGNRSFCLRAAAVEPLQVSTDREAELLRVTITVPQARVGTAYNSVCERLLDEYEAPPGQNKEEVPMETLVQACGGRRYFNYACIEEVMTSTMQEAMKPYERELVDGSVEVDSKPEELVETFDKDEPLTYKVSAEVGDNFTVDFMQPYTGMQISVPAVLNERVEKERVASAIRKMRREKGGRLTVADREARRGDTLMVDWSIRNLATQAVLPGMDHKRFEIDTEEPEAFLPGIMEKMYGMRSGEQQTVKFKFPDEWEPAELSGLETEVTFKIRDVLEWELPELTLDMCRAVAPTVADIDGFKVHVREMVLRDASVELQNTIQTAILQFLAEKTTVASIPKRAFKHFARGRYQHMLQDFVNEGRFSKEEAENAMKHEETLDQYIETQKNTLEGEFKAVLALDVIFDKEGLKIDEELMESQALAMMEEMQKDQPGLTVEQCREFIRSDMKHVATLAFIQEKATVTIEPLLD